MDKSKFEMDTENKKDLEEDEELSALRLAALATLKQRSTQNDSASFTQNNFCEQRNVANSCDNSLSNHIPFIQSDRSNHSQATGHGWRKNGKNIQPVRRRLGVFPKSNQRSNLIVINPVTPDENCYSKEPTPSLALPQHKWYNSGNEDSMSPKTFRRTGPTRFNRHESDSDDSDSDFEKSDDSGSNETVLQDEPSEKFSNITPESVRFEDANEKCRITEHRLSFSALDSQQNHDVDPEKTTSVYNSLKSRSFENSEVGPDISLRTAHIHNDSEQTWRNNNVPSEDHSKFEMKSPLSDKHELNKQDLCSTSKIEKTDYEHQYIKNIETAKLNNAWNYSNLRGDYLYSNDDQYSSSKNSEYQNVEPKRHSLPLGDLKTELKKSVEEYQNSKIMHTQKEFSEPWPPLHIETNDHGLKHKQNIDQKWHASASRKSSLSDEYLNKEYLQNNSKNQEQALSSNNSFQSHSFKKKELSSEIRSGRRYSKSPEYWKRNRRRNKSQSSDSSHRGSSQSPQKRDEMHQRKRSPSSDFSPKKRRPSTDYNHSDQSSTYKYKHRNKKSESPPRRRSRTPEHFQRKYKDSSDYTRWKHGKSSDNNRTKPNQASDFAERSNNSKRDQITLDDSDSSNSSTDHSWRKHNRSRERKRRERSWSNEADRKAERSCNDLSSSQQVQSESSKPFLDGKRQGDNLCSSNVLLKSTNEKLDQKQINYLQGSKDKDLKAQIPENNKNNRFVNNTRKSLFSPERKSYGSKLDTNYSNPKYNTQTENKDHGRNNEMKYGKYDQSRSRSSPHKYSNDKKFRSSDQKVFNRKNFSRSRSRSSSYSSTSSSSSSRSSPAIRSVSSVIKPVRMENVKTEIKHDSKHANKTHMLEGDLSSVPVKRHNSNERFPISSEVSRDKTSIVTENRNHVNETTKRVPVHMRLGTFPRKRLIQMNKDVEAAFVTTSSDDETDVNIKCKKQNLRIVTEMYDSKSKGSCIIERKVEQDSNVSRERPRILKSSHR